MRDPLSIEASAPNAARGGTLPLDVVVIHETNGAKYFEALLFLHQTGRIRSLQFFESSVLWKFAHSIRRERKSVPAALRQSFRNLRLRLSFWAMRNRVILIGVAPWDYRLLLYSPLRFSNHLIYHTSWPQWDGSVPRRYGPLTNWVRGAWIRLLREDRVAVAAATGLSGESAGAAIDSGQTVAKPISVICHVVSDVFFEHRTEHATPLRLLFLGELSEKKGLPDLQRVMDLLSDKPITLDIVGDGPLRDMAGAMAKRPGCHWHGHVRDRKVLAGIVASCQILVSPAVRTGRWEELFGISIVEAMASGLPCIASDHIGPRSIITSGVDGILLPERAPGAVAEAIERMLDDPAAWTAMSAQAALTARRYSLQETADRWERLFVARAAAIQPRLLQSSAELAKLL